MKLFIALLFVSFGAQAAITGVVGTQQPVQLKKSTAIVKNADGTPKTFATAELCEAEALRLWTIEGQTRTSGTATYSCISTEKWAVSFGVAPTPVETWTHCANENELCAFSGTRRVQYGADTRWVTRDIAATNGGVQCSNAVFGDPAQWTEKTCRISDAVIAPAPTPIGTAAVSWVAPTLNADGSPLTNLAGFVIRYGAQQITVDAAARSRVITDLPSGTHSFTVSAVNSLGVESFPSAPGTKVIP